MIYIKYFVIYSFLGFFYESFIYKNRNTNKHSGTLYGPYTLVYGIGCSISSFINIKLNYINNYFLNIIISFISFTIISTLIELICGHLIHFIYKRDSWNYSYKKYHLGKYITLDYALCWGILALIFTKFLSNFFFNLTSLFSNTFYIITLIIIFIDIIYSFRTKANYFVIH